MRLAIIVPLLFVACRQPAAIAIISVPGTHAQVGQRFTYPLVLSRPGNATFTLKHAPSDATLDGNRLLWTPTVADQGPASFTITANLKGATTERTFTVTVPTEKIEAQLAVDTRRTTPHTLTVKPPLSPVLGAGVAVPRDAFLSAAPKAITISSLKNAPMAGGALSKNLAEADVTTVEFGPSGYAWRTPVTIFVPVTPAVENAGQPGLFHYDYNSGQWEIVPSTYDAADHLLVAQVTHFSTYQAAPIAIEVPVQNVTTYCTSSTSNYTNTYQLVINDVLNTLVGPQTIGQQIAALPTGGKLALTLRHEVMLPSSYATTTPFSQQAVFTLTMNSNRTVTVQTAATQGASIAPSPALAVTDAALPNFLDGANVTWSFQSKPFEETFDAIFVIALTAVSSSANGAVISSYSNNVATVAQITPPSTTQSNVCSYDNAPLTITFSGGLFMTVDSATPVNLAITVGNVTTDQLTYAWTMTDQAGQTATDVNGNPIALGSGSSATIAAGMLPEGTYLAQVTVTAVQDGHTRTATATEYIERVPGDPPAIVISAAATQLTTTDTLRAVATPTGGVPPYVFQWRITPAAAAEMESDSAYFNVGPPFIGGADYTVEVTVTDAANQVTSDAVIISVDTPPATPTIVATPPAGTVPATAAYANFYFVAAQNGCAGCTDEYYRIDAGTGLRVALNALPVAAGASINNSLPNVPSQTVVLRRTNAAGEFVEATTLITVSPLLIVTSTVDTDGDGYPDNLDCAPDDPTISPGSIDICNDGIDQDCSGADTTTANCDADGDGQTVGNGDCNDNDPSTGKGFAELCDGVDNNCDGRIDEWFPTLGAACTDPCDNPGTVVCGASQLNLACHPTAVATACNLTHPGCTVTGIETCDGIDNDCNGIIDDVWLTFYDGPTGTSGVGICMPGVEVCKNGVLQPIISAQLPQIEICDGIDENCDGIADNNCCIPNDAGLAIDGGCTN